MAAVAVPAAAPAAAEKKLEPKVLRIGDVAPDFEADSSQGKLRWHDYIKDSWAVLMSHPRDFTPVCTTEIGKAARLSEEWAQRKVKIAVVSIDSAEDHKRWIKEISSLNGDVKIDFPIFDDISKIIANQYGMLDQTNLDTAGMPLTVRAVFIIGPDKKIKLIIVYPASTGRNFDEILRVIDSLQLTLNNKVATPADWKRGDDVTLLPGLGEEEARKLYPDFKVVSASCKLRTTKDPVFAKKEGEGEHHKHHHEHHKHH